MDIVTHACIGMIAATPVLDSHPELALGLVAGSVLPDLDALSRVFGKRAYLRSHQTWSHALPVHVVISALTGVLAHACGVDGLMLGLGLLVGLVIHVLLDFSNTLGVTLFAPFSRKRMCLAWVFFIDAVVLLLTFSVALYTFWSFFRNGETSVGHAWVFFGILAFCFAGKGMLRRRAVKLAAGTITLMPSALWPWRFFGVAETGDCVRLFWVNAITGRREVLATYEVLDATYGELLAQVPEFRLMRELSPAYHVVSAKRTAAGEIITCRDLRTRNFQTTFGDLEVQLDVNKRVTGTHFHV